MTGKSRGVTATERMLAEFCDKSFLKLWSYPNPYKDDGHELCDLLAVFGNYVPGNHRPSTFHADRIQHRFSLFCYNFGQYVMPALQAPDRRVCRLTDTIAIRDDIDHARKRTLHGALHAPAISPATEIASFLARSL